MDRRSFLRTGGIAALASAVAPGRALAAEPPPQAQAAFVPETRDGRRLAGGSLDPGYPLPGRIRQAQLPLPHGTDWRGLRLRAELEVKGVRHPVTWACTPKPNADGTLTLRPNLD